MPASPIDLTVAGQRYRIVTPAEPDDIHRLVAVLEERLAALQLPSRFTPPQKLLIAALALASDLEEERLRHRETQNRARESLTNLLQRIDQALELTEPPQANAATPLPQQL